MVYTPKDLPVRVKPAQRSVPVEPFWDLLLLGTLVTKKEGALCFVFMKQSINFHPCQGF